jgi:hypothetical protein
LEKIFAAIMSLIELRIENREKFRMTKSETALRALIAFIPATYLTSLFYKDFFFESQQNQIPFLIWGMPCLHLLVSFFQMFGVVLGKGYSKRKEFTIVRVIPLFKRYNRLKRFFLTISVDGRTKILSCLNVHQPKSITVFVNPFGKLKIFSASEMIVRVAWVIVGVIISMFLKVLIL